MKNRCFPILFCQFMAGICTIVPPVLAAAWNTGDVDAGTSASIAIDSTGNPHISYQNAGPRMYASWDGSDPQDRYAPGNCRSRFLEPERGDHRLRETTLESAVTVL